MTIKGTHLTAVTAVTFGATASPTFSATGSTMLSVKSPAHGPAKVDVSVETTHGSITSDTAFTYAYPVPTVTGITPASGPTTGGSVATVTGTKFSGAGFTTTSVKFGSTTGTLSR